MSGLRESLDAICSALQAIERRLSGLERQGETTQASVMAVEVKMDAVTSAIRDGFEALGQFHLDWQTEKSLNAEQHQRLHERLKKIEIHCHSCPPAA
jgi:chromosome segregation ATPase